MLYVLTFSSETFQSQITVDTSININLKNCKINLIQRSDNIFKGDYYISYGVLAYIKKSEQSEKVIKKIIFFLFNLNF